MKWFSTKNWKPLEHPEAYNKAYLSPGGTNVLVELDRGYDTVIPFVVWEEYRQRGMCVAFFHPRDGHKDRKKHPYAVIGWQGSQRPIHMLVLRPTGGLLIDHKNFDTLDNRRKNLRYATPYQSSAHTIRKPDMTSGYRGVNYRDSHRRDERTYWNTPWWAQIAFEGKQFRMGPFATREEAAQAYDEKAREFNRIWGDQWYPLNFPEYSGEISALDGSVVP